MSRKYLENKLIFKLEITIPGHQTCRVDLKEYMVSKYAKPDPHVLSGKTGHWELLNQTNNLAHYSK